MNGLSLEIRNSRSELYRKLIVVDCNFPHKFLWKVKVPTKIKVFLWLVARKSILTKDIRLKRGWKGSKLCVFCGKDGTIDHLFFTCSAAVLVWCLLKCAFGLNSVPSSVENYFGRWIKTFRKNEKRLVLVGIFAVFWTLWKCRNGIIFDSKLYNDPMILIKLICFWIVGGSILQIKVENKEVLMLGGKLLKRVANEVYRSSQGWRHGDLRIGG